MAKTDGWWIQGGSEPIQINGDSQGFVQLAKNLTHVPTKENIAGIMTKAVSKG